MCSDAKYLLALLVILALGCSPLGKMQKVKSGTVALGLSIMKEEPLADETPEIVVDSLRGTLTDGPLIMNAIRDSETGEMVATDVISASKVTARFRNVAERAGQVSLTFDITVPAGMSDSHWQLKINPFMKMMEDTIALEPVYITGKHYRERQMRGYERYRAFLSTIITDTADFIRVRQLEVFLSRHYPETYAMKCDSSFISEPMAENLFGVTQRDALTHYTRQLKWNRNERRKANAGRRFRSLVKDPIVTEGIRLDTVLVDSSGDFVYRYEHTFRSRPALRKVNVFLLGSLYERGECCFELPFPEDLTFYISSLSSLADERLRYKMVVQERMVYDNTKALIDFAQGSAAVDTLLGNNASEIRRVRRCIDDVVSRNELALDSLVIMASCSPEGVYAVNRRLSKARSESVMRFIADYVPPEWRDSLKASELPENWKQLARLVEYDTLMSERVRNKILGMMVSMEDPDKTEKALAGMDEYRYLREKIYPQLRSVSFDFYLHRVDLQKDTVYTTEIDTVYMSGVQALKELDYKTAVRILRPYDDYNAALAFISAGYNHSALDVLSRLDGGDAKTCYLMSMALARLGQMDEALGYFELCVAYDPYMEHRANLDPEMYDLIQIRNKHLKN